MRGWGLLLACAVLIGCRTNESPEGQVDDLQIMAQVKAKLATEVGPMSITNVSVNSTNGVVTLSGQVDSAQTRDKVEAVAKSVPKVLRVVDSIQVALKPTSRVTGAAMAAAQNAKKDRYPGNYSAARGSSPN